MVSTLGRITPRRIEKTLARIVTIKSTQGGSPHHDLELRLTSSLVIDDCVEKKSGCGGADFHWHYLALFGWLDFFKRKQSGSCIVKEGRVSSVSIGVTISTPLSQSFFWRCTILYDHYLTH